MEYLNAIGRVFASRVDRLEKSLGDDGPFSQDHNAAHHADTDGSKMLWPILWYLILLSLSMVACIIGILNDEQKGRMISTKWWWWPWSWWKDDDRHHDTDTDIDGDDARTLASKQRHRPGGPKRTTTVPAKATSTATTKADKKNR
jgi:hypothetical protein